MNDEPDTKWNVQVKFQNDKPQDKTAEVQKKVEPPVSRANEGKVNKVKQKSSGGPRT